MLFIFSLETSRPEILSSFILHIHTHQYQLQRLTRDAKVRGLRHACLALLSSKMQYTFDKVLCNVYHCIEKCLEEMR